MKWLVLYFHLVITVSFADGTEKPWPLPVLKHDPAVRPAIEKVLGDPTRGARILRDVQDKTLVELFVQVDRSPTNMAFDVSLRNGKQTWRAGPVAWRRGEIDWWAYQFDLPEEIEEVDIVYTLSPRAGMLMSRFPTYPVKGLSWIWSGEPIVAANVKIRVQGLRMSPEKPPGEEEMREYLVDSLLPDSDVSKSVAGGASFEDLRKQSHSKAFASNARPEVIYEWACVRIAQGGMENAMDKLVKVREEPGLQERVQRQLRYICARWLYQAQNGRIPEMIALGRAYHNGHGVGQDSFLGSYWLQKAVNAGSVKAAEQLASFAPMEKNSRESINQAQEAYQRQAEQWHRPVKQTYADWLKAYTENPGVLTRGVFIGVRAGDNTEKKVVKPSEQLKLVVTNIYEDGDSRGDMRLRNGVTSNGSKLYMDGKHKSFSLTPYSLKGGGGDRPLPDVLLERIDVLMANLPEDTGVLPPPNRRVLFELFPDQANREYRIFDTANAPVQVLELMRLMHAGGAHVPEFEAEKSLYMRGHESEGIVAVSHQNELLYNLHSDRLQWWNGESIEFIAETKIEAVKKIEFSPDNVHALVQSSWDTVLIDLHNRLPLRKFERHHSGQYFKQGKLAMFELPKDNWAFLDTETWQPVERPKELPIEFSKYFPAPTIPRAVVRKTDGSVVLWDTEKRQMIRQISTESEPRMRVAYSPDESKISVFLASGTMVYTATRPVSMLTIDSKSGETINNPGAFGMVGDFVEFLNWSPDGEYIFAATGYMGRGSRISVFNAKTGRHRAQLTGPSSIIGVAYVPTTRELVAGDTSGKLWFWDFPEVLKRIGEFESSLNPKP